MPRHLTARLSAALLLAASPPALAAGSTELVSLGSRGQQGNEVSIRGGLSADGSIVAFTSYATNLVQPDANGTKTDILVRNRRAGKTRRADVSSAGVQANDASDDPFISRSGRFVSFGSLATNLVAGDGNGVQDVFLHDRNAGTTVRASVGSHGEEANGESRSRGLSGNGRYVVFGSVATNLVGGDTNGQPDVFVHDRVTGVTSRESVGTGGVEANGLSAANTSNPGSISGDGRFLVFHSFATNLAANDQNGVPDVFIRDRKRGTTSLVSVASDGSRGNGASASAAVSDNGRYVMFSSDATNLVPNDGNGAHDVFLRDLRAGTTIRVSTAADGGDANGPSQGLTMSGNGRFVLYFSLATNIVSGDNNGTNDLFVYDRTTGKSRRLVGQGGEEPNAASNFPAITPNGRLILFSSDASNIVAGDTNATTDVFLTNQHLHPALATPPARRAPARPVAGGRAGAVAASLDVRRW